MTGSPAQECFVEVDGQRFRIWMEDSQSQYNYDWLTDPNDDYGFSSSSWLELTPDDHVSAIRDFLAAIDPTTGYMAD